MFGKNYLTTAQIVWHIGIRRAQSYVLGKILEHYLGRKNCSWMLIHWKFYRSVPEILLLFCFRFTNLEGITVEQKNRKVMLELKTTVKIINFEK